MILLLPSEDTSEDASEKSATSDLTAEGDDDIVDVHLAVAILILEQLCDSAENGGNQGYQGSVGRLAEIEVLKNTVCEDVTGEGGHRALGR